MEGSQWNFFLTPSTTPTDATFSPSVLQTPRSSTHFQDAFSPYGHQQHVSGTPFTSMEQLSENMFDQAAMSASFAQDPNQTHFFQSPKHTGAATFQPIPQHVPVQTPPSAPQESEKRRTIRPHSIMFGTPTSINQVLSGQNNTMDRPQGGIMHSSAGRPGMSMEFRQQQHSNMGPPPAQPYWNLSQAMAMPNQQSNGLADPFVYNGQSQDALQSSGSPPFVTTTPQLFTPARQPQIQQAPVVPSNAQKPLPPPPADSNANMMRGPGGVDPTLLYTSPNRMAPPAGSQPAVPTTRTSDSMSPEKPASQVAVGTPAGKSPVDQLSPLSDGDAPRPSTSGGLRGGPRRPGTADHRRPHSMYGSLESMARSMSSAGIQRKSSPLKRSHRNSTASLASILEASTPKAKPPTLHRARTSIVLTVDGTGRARTETRTFDPSPTKAMQSRYPSLWNESDSDSESDHTTTSSQQPCLGPKSEDRRRARIDSTLESLEGFHLPRSESSTSIRSPVKTPLSAAAQLRRQTSVKKPTHSRRNTLSSTTGSMSDRDAMLLSSDEDAKNGDAGAALRRVISRRDQHRVRAQQRGGHDRSQSMLNLTAGLEMPYASPAKQPPVQQQQQLLQYAEPVTRCICNAPFQHGQSMIQCSACRCWLHMACLGIPPERAPHGYYCTFCMAAPVQQQMPMHVQHSQHGQVQGQGQMHFQPGHGHGQQQHYGQMQMQMQQRGMEWETAAAF